MSLEVSFASFGRRSSPAAGLPRIANWRWAKAPLSRFSWPLLQRSRNAETRAADASILLLFIAPRRAKGVARCSNLPHELREGCNRQQAADCRHPDFPR